MLKITPQSALQFNPLDEPPDFDLLDLPPQWTGEHCALRLCEGFKTLRQLPLKGAPPGFKNGWSWGYLYEWEDLLAQHQQEHDEIEKTMRPQNRVRLQPSLREVTFCEAVITWGGRSLRLRASLRGCEHGRAGAFAGAGRRLVHTQTRRLWLAAAS